MLLCITGVRSDNYRGKRLATAAKSSCIVAVLPNPVKCAIEELAFSWRAGKTLAKVNRALASALPGGKSQRISGLDRIKRRDQKAKQRGGARVLLRQPKRGQYVFYFVQELGKAYGLTSRSAGVMDLRIGGRMAMPNAAQLIPRIDALLIVH